MVIIVGAMQEELQAIIDQFQLSKTKGTVFPEFCSADQQLLVCVTGIGTVNASAGLSSLLTKYPNVEFVLNFGTAGATSKTLKQGDVVLVDQAVYGSVDVRAFGYQLGQVPRMPSHYQANGVVMTRMLEKLHKLMPVQTVNAVTMDLFVDTIQQVGDWITPLPLVSAIVDMEIASYYQTAFLFGVPIVSVKIVSDSIGSLVASSLEFDQFLPQAQKKLAEVLQIVLN